MKTSPRTYIYVFEHGTLILETGGKFLRDAGETKPFRLRLERTNSKSARGGRDDADDKSTPVSSRQERLLLIYSNRPRVGSGVRDKGTLSATTPVDVITLMRLGGEGRYRQIRQDRERYAFSIKHYLGGFLFLWRRVGHPPPAPLTLSRWSVQDHPIRNHPLIFCSTPSWSGLEAGPRLTRSRPLPSTWVPPAGLQLAR